jgi:hypothetical protein
MDSPADKEERKREVYSLLPHFYLKVNSQGNSTTVLHNESSVRFPTTPTPLYFNRADWNVQVAAERNTSRTLSRHRKNKTPSNQKRSNVYGTKMMSSEEKMKL